MSIQLNDVKCVIWDLDDTFWKGTLSEGGCLPIKENIDFVRKLNDYGIVSSICSKNDEAQAKKALEGMGVLDEFVFVSINWQPKGERIARTISDMGLRSYNILFLDDNPVNLEEARFYCKDIMTAYPDEIKGLSEQLDSMPIPSNGRKRLNQYKILEAKVEDKLHSASNDDFLRDSQIKVVIDTQCAKNLDRVYELVHRTNQLNFTKIRSSREELEAIISDPSYSVGTVQVSDKYGDYGIVGFYAVKDGKAVHFAFSCRTLGMNVEQWIYAYLGFPKIDVIPDVATELKQGYCPDYINQNDKQNSSEKTQLNGKVLFKGPCDLDQIFGFIDDSRNIRSEFSYHSNVIGATVQYNHSITIVESVMKEHDAAPFTEPELYQTDLFDGAYNAVFISMLPDTTLGVYRNKKTGKQIVFGDYKYSLVDEQNWDKYLNGIYYTANFHFTREFLTEFASEYEYEGLISTYQYYENLCIIREHIPSETKLFFINGTELEFINNQNPAYADRHIVHRQFNAILKRLCDEYENTFVFDVNKYVTAQDDFRDSPNHYQRKVYYAMAEDIAKLINENSDGSVGTMNMHLAEARKFARLAQRKIKRILGEKN